MKSGSLPFIQVSTLLSFPSFLGLYTESSVESGEPCKMEGNYRFWEKGSPKQNFFTKNLSDSG